MSSEIQLNILTRTVRPENRTTWEPASKFYSKHAIVPLTRAEVKTIRTGVFVVTPAAVQPEKRSGSMRVITRASQQHPDHMRLIPPDATACIAWVAHPATAPSSAPIANATWQLPGFTQAQAKHRSEPQITLGFNYILYLALMTCPPDREPLTGCLIGETHFRSLFCDWRNVVILSLGTHTAACDQYHRLAH